MKHTPRSKTPRLHNRVAHHMQGDMPTDERLIARLEPLTANLWAHLDRTLDLKSLQLHQNRSGAIAYRMATDSGELLLAELASNGQALDIMLYNHSAAHAARKAIGEYAAENRINVRIQQYFLP